MKYTMFSRSLHFFCSHPLILYSSIYTSIFRIWHYTVHTCLLYTGYTHICYTHKLSTLWLTPTMCNVWDVICESLLLSGLQFGSSKQKLPDVKPAPTCAAGVRSGFGLCPLALIAGDQFKLLIQAGKHQWKRGIVTQPSHGRDATWWMFPQHRCPTMKVQFNKTWL